MCWKLERVGIFFEVLVQRWWWGGGLWCSTALATAPVRCCVLGVRGDEDLNKKNNQMNEMQKRARIQIDSTP